MQRANITPERVLEAVRVALQARPEVQTKDVAITLLPELADTAVVGRQAVVNRVSLVMRKMAGAGQLVQHRPEDSDGGRKTCRYAIEADVDA